MTYASDVFPLPPKMLAQFVERARKGEASEILPDDYSPIYIFKSLREEVTIIGPLEDGLALGHYKKIK